MKLPKQSVPVRRPDLIEPHTTVDLEILLSAIEAGGSSSSETEEPEAEVLDSTVDVERLEEAVRNLRFNLLHGANYNDPMRFLSPVSFCGCQILSGQARARCSAACGWF